MTVNRKLKQKLVWHRIQKRSERRKTSEHYFVTIFATNNKIWQYKKCTDFE